MTFCLIFYITLIYNNQKNSTYISSFEKNFLKNDPNLKECVKVLNKLKINHWICYGTLLGVIRNKYLLPWDNDIDIGTWEQKNKNKIISAFYK